VTELNHRPDYDRLLNVKALATWTWERQGEHGEDARTYEAALASFQTQLRSQHVEGDGRRSAVRRSKKVERHLKALVKASRKAERAAEGLRNSYASHVAHVAALPGEREAKALKKGGGSAAAVAAMTAKSLHKTASAAAPASAEESATPAAPAAGQPRGMADLWKGRSA
jgi:hypothetical protein